MLVVAKVKLMGRRKDNPLEQAAKGYPGRRKSAVEKEIEAIANQVAAVPDAAADPFPLPDIFKKSPVYWKGAIAIWNAQGEVLRVSGRRRPAYRHGLARYCIWQHFFYEACESLRKNGQTITFTKGDGNDKMQRNPALDMMRTASVELRLLENEFGFTPSADNDLLKVEGFNADQGRLPLGGEHPSSKRASTPETEVEAGHDPMGMMNDTDSPPPGSLPN